MSRFLAVLLAALMISTIAFAAEPLPAGEVTGSLSWIDGMTVLHIWGTPREQGHAIGVLLGNEIVELYDRLIAYRTWNLTAERWDSEVLPAAQRFTLVPEYREEFEGMLEGIESQAGGPAQIPSLGRELRVEDLVAASYLYDNKRLGCTSFAACRRGQILYLRVRCCRLDCHGTTTAH